MVDAVARLAQPLQQELRRLLVVLDEQQMHQVECDVSRTIAPILSLPAGTLLDEGVARLAASAAPPRIDTAHPRLDAELLLAHVLGATRTHLKSHRERPCGPREREAYLELIARRAAGEPLAYLVGTKDFWSVRLAVGPAVLVPRPETELLVERALALRPDPAGEAADLGTGSGAIALALASERPGWRIVATDISAEALDLAQRNAAELRAANVEFLAGSWLAPLGARRFHLVVSNPPYVAADDPVLASPPLTFEPRGALTCGRDALAALREIIAGAPAHLEPGGWLLLEHGAAQAAEVARELVARGFTHVRSHRDLAGHERMTEGCRR
jgi:release factor glutamine methyltransferase